MGSTAKAALLLLSCLQAQGRRLSSYQYNGRSPVQTAQKGSKPASPRAIYGLSRFIRVLRLQKG